MAPPDTPTPAQPEKKREPKRTIVLLGTFTDSVEELASALVSINGGDAKRWFVGDSIEDGVVLTSVRPDGIEYKEGDTIMNISIHPLSSSLNTAAPYPSRRSKEAMLERKSVPGQIQPPRRHTPARKYSQP